MIKTHGTRWCDVLRVIRVCKCNLQKYGNRLVIFILFDFPALYFVLDTTYRQEELLWYNSSQKIRIVSNLKFRELISRSFRKLPLHKFSTF